MTVAAGRCSREPASSSPALWCGMLAFFGAFGARIVLETSPSRHAAGAVNRRSSTCSTPCRSAPSLLLGARPRRLEPRPAVDRRVRAGYAAPPPRDRGGRGVRVALRRDARDDGARATGWAPIDLVSKDGPPAARMGTASRPLVAHARRAARRVGAGSFARRRSRSCPEAATPDGPHASVRAGRTPSSAARTRRARGPAARPRGGSGRSAGTRQNVFGPASAS